MTRQLVFLALLVLSSLYAMIRGGRPERIGAVTLFGGACLTVLAASPFSGRFRQVETGIFIIDMVMLNIFLWLSIRSTRFWPIWISALLGAEVVVHVALMLMPNVVPQAYMHAIALWAWLAQIILVVATSRHRQRLKHWGADAPWKT